MNIKAPKKNTKDCFKDFYYRDSNFDAWLPKVQPARAGDVTVLELTKEMTFLEMAEHFLGTTDPKEIRKHALTLPMVEKMVESADTNGMHTNGYGNFFFVENEDGSVSVGRVGRGVGDRRCRADVYELSDGDRWRADFRLVVCNLDTRNLETSVPVSDLEARISTIEEVLRHHSLGL